jgi:hypothetical protein
MPDKQQFKLVVAKVESKYLCDPEWVVSEEPWALGASELVVLVYKALREARKTTDEWDAENARILREGL